MTKMVNREKWGGNEFVTSQKMEIVIEAATEERTVFLCCSWVFNYNF